MYKTPAEDLSFENISSIDLFRIPSRSMLSVDEWPESFWDGVGDRIGLDDLEHQKLLSLLQELPSGSSARCHMPPWGVALYAMDQLIYSFSICFECDNAYLYSKDGRDLRAFNTDSDESDKLFSFLNEKLPLD